ncbi:hypothetical protein HZB01_01460 [Candidatus Woesearchaeota archaeon]|nr:hypothetical protein [Candidatus Woesearchaeota archaeon]
MSQEEVLEFLKSRKNQWFTANEMSEGLDLSLISVRMALKLLKQNRDVAFQRSTKRGNPYEYCFEKKK